MRPTSAPFSRLPPHLTGQCWGWDLAMHKLSLRLSPGTPGVHSEDTDSDSGESQGTPALLASPGKRMTELGPGSLARPQDTWAP